MDNEAKSKSDKDTFTQEYEELMKTSKSSVVVNTEWNAKGDSFQKLSMYVNHTPVQTSGSTTLTNIK